MDDENAVQSSDPSAPRGARSVKNSALNLETTGNDPANRFLRCPPARAHFRAARIGRVAVAANVTARLCTCGQREPPERCLASMAELLPRKSTGERSPS